jgi:hypothetical protein
MKTLIAAMCVLALTGCASTNSKQQDTSSSTDKAGVESRRLAETAFEEAGGTLNLVFDAQGNWVKITAKGTAAISDDTPGGREIAMTIATMRAKRTVAEFLSSEVRSSKTLTRIARSYARTYQSSDTTKPLESLGAEDEAAMSLPTDTEEDRHAQRLASTLTEQIRDNSSAILKGAFVSQRIFEGERVTVELTASRESIEAARQVTRMMRGVMQ